MIATNDKLTFSFIVPVYNRPDEVEELLESMSSQTEKDFELVIVEDGSNVLCEDICKRFEQQLSIKYFFKQNSGPGQSRNYGFERATGNYCIFLDSDCVLPNNYFEIVKNHLAKKYVDAFGGPDQAHEDFTNFQKAINYSMTSFFTTGGIRGKSEKIEKFQPRSFNMGYSREVFDTTNGFGKMRFGEDIDMSIRIIKNNFSTALIKEAFVYHKRRTSYKQFFKQIYNSGIARINLYKEHPQSLKLVHLVPSVFTVGCLLLILLAIFASPYFIAPILLYALLIFIDSSIKNKSIVIGATSVTTSFIQLFSYGFGFLNATWKRLILRQDIYTAYENSFYD